MVGPQIKYRKECEQSGISHFCLHFFIKKFVNFNFRFTKVTGLAYQMC